MIGSKDLVTLLSLLSEEDKPLETVSTTFNRIFNKNDHFKIGCAIYTMIKDGFIRVPSHRLISFYILYSLFNQNNHNLLNIGHSSFTTPIHNTSTDSSTTDTDNNNNEDNNNNSGSGGTSPTTTSPSHKSSSSATTSSYSSSSSYLIDYPITFNPFLPIFIDELQKQCNLVKSLVTDQQQQKSKNINPIERHFLIQFLTNLPKDFSKKTSKDIGQQQLPAVELTLPNLNDYRRFYLDKLSQHSFPSLKSIGVSPTIFFNNNATDTSNNNQTKQDINITTQELSLFSFEPSFHRPPPPLFGPINTIWINSTINHGLLLSPMMSIKSGTSNPKKVVRDLMSRAIRTRLPKAQLQQIKQELDQDPKLVLYSGLEPKKLPNLVENNTQVAIEALLKLVHSPDFKDYFQELVSMSMSYRSMEVVNALATSVELPPHFINMYISNCIASCNSNSKDKVNLQRSVRLVCVFIQSLIRTNIININDLYEEVHNFCLEHSKIRDAISLFKLMREANGVSPNVSSPNSSSPSLSSPSSSSTTNN